MSSSLTFSNWLSSVFSIFIEKNRVLCKFADVYLLIYAHSIFWYGTTGN